MNSPADEFVFSPDAQIWRLSREHALLVGGPAAAILQVAHPEIAAGVAAHSAFRADALGRLRRTLEAVYTITFARRTEAEETARRVAAVHARVRGGSPVAYNAFSPAAQLWVLATLIQVGRQMFEHFVAPLNSRDREAHFREMRVFGRFFGLDPAFGPQTEVEFQDYYRDMLEGPLLASHPLCREVAWAVALPHRPRALGLMARPLLSVVVETLPTPVRERLGFRSTPGSRAVWRTVRGLGKLALPLLPPVVRYAPQYRRACAARSRSSPV